MRPPVHDEPLAAVRLADLRSVGAVVVDDLGEQVGGAVGAAQATCPLFRVILPADRLAGANAEHHSLEVNDLGLGPSIPQRRRGAQDVRLGPQQHGERQGAQRVHLAGEDLSPRAAQVGVAEHVGVHTELVL